jgi:uncharacterized membrane protein
MFEETPDSHRTIFIVGLILLAVELLGVGVLFMVAPAVPLKIAGVIATTGVGGQAGAIIAGLRVFGLRPWPLAAVLSAFNLVHLCLFFPLFTSLYHRAARMRFIGKIAVSTHRAAERQKDRVSRLGALGLPLFIWLPFPWTGTLVGAVIGYLMGIRTGRIMLIAVPTMLLSVLTWIFGVSYLVMLTEIKTELTVVVLLGLVALFTYLRIHSRRSREEAGEEATTEGGE